MAVWEEQTFLAGVGVSAPPRLAAGVVTESGAEVRAVAPVSVMGHLEREVKGLASYTKSFFFFFAHNVFILWQ